jgi:hypothetical protein
MPENARELIDASRHHLAVAPWERRMVLVEDDDQRFGHDDPACIAIPPGAVLRARALWYTTATPCPHCGHRTADVIVAGFRDDIDGAVPTAGEEQLELEVAT